MNEITKVVAEIAKKSSTAEDFFTYAACRDRNVREGVSRMKQIKAQMRAEGFDPVPQDLKSMFRDLEKAGMGVLKGEMFKWNLGIRKVGAAGIEGKEILVKPEAPKEPQTVSKTVVVMFSNGSEVSVQITGSVTKADMKVLYDKLLQSCEK